MIHTLHAAAITLAGSAPDDVDPSTGKGPEWGKAAPIGLLIIVLMGIALVFLLRSMNKQLKKVRPSYDGSGDSAAADAGDDFLPDPVPDRMADPVADPVADSVVDVPADAAPGAPDDPPAVESRLGHPGQGGDGGQARGQSSGHGVPAEDRSG